MHFHSLSLLYARTWCHAVGYPDITAYHGVVADGDAAQDTGVGIDGDIILDDGMTRDVEHISVSVFLEALGTQRHTLIQRHMIAYYTCFAYNYTRAVINGEVLTYLRPGMNVDTSL